jgi:carboxyl-terminal processing protease|eukprot:Transcript_26391.p1 GENE.Transcript_26391~~Transcript_26391.p1  ORF type:complete len:301 (-),score=109.53 Transcript_26391:1342-2244(-)
MKVPWTARPPTPAGLAALSVPWADGAAAAVLAACLCGSLLTGAPCRALADVAPNAPALSQPEPSSVADEAWALLDKYYLDRTFGGLNWPAERQRLRSLEPMSDQKAFDEAENLVRRLGDKYSRVLAPSAAAKLNKFDVTGVGLNLIINDSGDMKVGSVPAPDSESAKVGIKFGDEVLSINSRDTKGMTSFDALEAIQGEGRTVDVTIRSPGKPPRELVMTKAFMEKDPVQTRLVESGGGKVGYIKLREFNARCKRRVGEALAELRQQGATRLVLDLRGNGGGVLDGAMGISARRPAAGPA